MKLPLLKTVDLLVIEASLTGMAAARKAALRGEKVLAVESRTYPGCEMAEWKRPWMTAGGADWEKLSVWFPGGEKAAPGETFAFSEDAFKRRAEDLLIGAGADLLYAVRPVSVRRRGKGFRVLLAGKAGLCAVDAARLLDCSESRITAYTTSFAPDWEARLGTPGGEAFTSEWIGLSLPEGELCVPELPGVRVTVRQSGFCAENRLIELAFSGRRARDDVSEAIEACRVLARLPAFEGARFGALSERGMPLAAYDPAEALRLADGVLSAFDGGARFVRVSLTGVSPAVPAPRRVPETGICLPCDPACAGRYEMVEEPAFPVAPEAERDVVVCGGGTSGASCARAAAEEGASVLVLDGNRRLGGTGTAGGVHYYWYGRRRGFTARIDREVRELAEQFRLPKTFYVWGEHDDWNMELKAETLRRGCVKAGAAVRFGAIVFGAAREGNRVTGVFAATERGPVFFPARVVVDATGDGDVAAAAGAGTVYGSRRDRMTMWSCLAQFKQAGQYKGGVFTTSADVSDWEDYTRYLLVNRRRGPADCYDHGTYLAPRETRHIRGDYTVTVREIARGARYPDTVTRCFSNFDTKGKSDADLVYFGFLPPQMEMDIPYRASLPAGLEGLLVTGKAVSATHDASSGLRMQDDLQNHGGAIGLAAAMAARAGGVRRVDGAALHRELVRRGVVPADGAPFAPEHPDIAAVIAGLTGDEPFETIDMDMSETAREISPIALICLAGREEAVPPLRRAYAESGGARRFLLARLLLWHRDPSGADELLAAVSRALDETDGLPRREGSVKFCQPYPDHGVMAEVSYLVNELWKLDDPRVPPLADRLAERIAASPRDFSDRRTCVFSHIESVAYLAERAGDPAYRPALRRLLGLPEFAGIERTEGFDVDPMEERILWSKLIVARALARCGGKDGYEALLVLTGDARRLAAKSAADELMALTGAPASGLAAAVEALPENPAPQPWTEEIW